METNLPIRVLHLEDNPLDIELIAETAARGGLKCAIKSVRTRDGLRDCLSKPDWDIILADFGLPGFDGLSALAIAREMRPTTPFVFVTGTMGEDNAVESLKHGATDYVLKQNLARLAPAVTTEVTPKRYSEMRTPHSMPPRKTVETNGASSPAT